MTDDDHNLDDLKNRLSRGFGVQVREDLQVRAEIIIQPEEGRWVFTANELSDLAEGLKSVLLKRMALPSDAQATRRPLRSLTSRFQTDTTILNGTLTPIDGIIGRISLFFQNEH